MSKIVINVEVVTIIELMMLMIANGLVHETTRFMNVVDHVNLIHKVEMSVHNSPYGNFVMCLEKLYIFDKK